MKNRRLVKINRIIAIILTIGFALIAVLSYLENYKIYMDKTGRYHNFRGMDRP